MHTLEQINKMALDDPSMLIKLAENDYKAEIESLAQKIISNNECKIVLLAGPSASGKTTSAHILKDNLLSKKIDCEVVSLDHFYLSGDKLPKQPNGEPDFETVYALDLPLLHSFFAKIVEAGKADIPIFDFTSSRRSKKSHLIKLKPGGILIVEGLHALNPVLTENLPAESTIGVYVSVNMAIKDKNENVVLTGRKLRLARRISRDFLYRNTTAKQTLKFWTAVVKGEEKYLYCFKDIADVQLKTFHSYEPCIFAPIITKALEHLPGDTENYDYAMQLKAGLEKFVPLPFNPVPQDSLVREFIEGGIYENID